VGIPYVHWNGVEGKYNVIVTDLLGPNMDDLFEFCGNKFTLKTVLKLADQMISRLEYLHSKNYIHRDIKPNNFLMGTATKGHTVCLIDYGLSKEYIDPKTQQHIAYNDYQHLIGSTAYASVNTHEGCEQSRRDDMESLGFVFMFFLRGNLPWLTVKGRTKRQRREQVKELKMDLKTLCESFPSEFFDYFTYVRSLKFEDKPDYEHLRKLFGDLYVREGFQVDNNWDWILKRDEELLRGNLAGAEQSSSSAPQPAASTGGQPPASTASDHPPAVTASEPPASTEGQHAASTEIEAPASTDPQPPASKAPQAPTSAEMLTAASTEIQSPVSVEPQPPASTEPSERVEE
jgi:serine/threonine protein kinase